MINGPKQTVVQRVRNSISGLRYSYTAKVILKWMVILAACTMIFVAGYFVSGIQQIFPPPLPPEACPKGEGGLLIADCVAHRTLLATEAGADAARVYMWLTLAGVFLSIATLIGLLITLGLNRQALDAAKQANKDTAEIGQAQVRAYVALTDLKLLREGGGYILSASAINAGSSPAFKVQWSSRIGFRHGDIPEGIRTHVTFDREHSFMPTNVELASGGNVVLPSHAFMQKVFQGFTGTYPLFLEIKLRYCDVFNQARETVERYNFLSFEGENPAEISLIRYGKFSFSEENVLDEISWVIPQGYIT